MNSILLRYQFSDPNPVKTGELVSLLRQNFGGAVHFVADGTIMIETSETSELVFQRLSPLFNYDDKLFVGELREFHSMHQISRSRPSIHKVAI